MNEIPQVNRENRIIFRKTAEQLEERFRMYLKALARKIIVHRNNRALKDLHSTLEDHVAIEAFLQPAVPEGLAPFIISGNQIMDSDDDFDDRDLNNDTNSRDLNDDAPTYGSDDLVSTEFPRSSPVRPFRPIHVAPIGVSTTPAFFSSTAKTSSKAPRKPRTCVFCGSTTCAGRNNRSLCPDSRLSATSRILLPRPADLRNNEQNRKMFALATTSAKHVSSGDKAFMPEFVSQYFPAFLSKRAAVDLSIVFYLRACVGKGIGPFHVYDVIKQQKTRRHAMLELQYLSLPPVFSKFRDPGGYNGLFPSVSYLVKLLIAEISRMRNYLDFEVQRRQGEMLCMDHYHGLCKHLSPVNGHRLFKALWTGKNEYLEIRLQKFVLSTGHSEIEDALREFKETRKAFNQPELKVIYVDNCCHERKFLEETFPELQRGLAELNELPVPKNLHVMDASTDVGVKPMIEPLLHHIKNIRDGDPRLVIGLDAEWPKTEKVRLIQVAVSDSINNEPVKDVVYLFDMRSTTKLPECMRDLLFSEKVLKVGRKVAEDLSRIAKSFDLGPESSKPSDVNLDKRRTDSSDIGELAKIAKKKGVIEKETGGSLQYLTSKVLKFKLGKDLQASDWGKTKLTPNQLLYAARDAWASLMVFKTLFVLPNKDFSDLASPPAASPSVSPIDEAMERRPSNLTDSFHLTNLQRIAESFPELPLPPEPAIATAVADLTVETTRTDQSAVRNTPRTRIKLDVLHASKRIEVSSKHPASVFYFQDVRDAWLEAVPSDVRAFDTVHAQKGTSFKQMMITNPKYALKRVRRTIPEPERLRQRLEAVFKEYSKDGYNDENGQPLLTEKAKAEFRNLLKHVDDGCLSDLPDVCLYRKTGVDKDGLPLYMCCRGTNDVESLHQALELMFRSFNCGMDLVDEFLAYIRHVFNVGASIPTYKWWTLTFGRRTSATPETFGITPSLPPHMQAVIEAKSLERYPPVYQHLCRRMKELIPCLPVHTVDEIQLFNRAVGFYISGGIETNRRPAKSGALRSDDMARRWNEGKLFDHTRPNMNEIPQVNRENRIIFRKTAEQLEERFRMYLKALARKTIVHRNNRALKDLHSTLEDHVVIEAFLQPAVPEGLGPFIISGNQIMDSDDDFDDRDLNNDTNSRDLNDDAPTYGSDDLVSTEFPRSSPVRPFRPIHVAPIGVSTTPAFFSSTAKTSSKAPRKPRTCVFCGSTTCAGRNNRSLCPDSRLSATSRILLPRPADLRNNEQNRKMFALATTSAKHVSSGDKAL
ncbi:hypothetical protein HDU97_005071 [Phlyctochytrium planicorne]|nr:hypothetical protein HDU97_005071 [Phlyctochytrium planicorne]